MEISCARRNVQTFRLSNAILPFEVYDETDILWHSLLMYVLFDILLYIQVSLSNNGFDTYRLKKGNYRKGEYVYMTFIQYTVYHEDVIFVK